jgi:hypothetical protein
MDGVRNPDSGILLAVTIGAKGIEIQLKKNKLSTPIAF